MACSIQNNGLNVVYLKYDHLIITYYGELVDTKDREDETCVSFVIYIYKEAKSAENEYFISTHLYRRKLQYLQFFVNNLFEII